jgi:hypothetical protein
MSENYSSGVTPQPSDTERQLLVKILNSLNGGSIGAGGSYIAYAGPPLVNPPNLQNIVVDSNGRQWQYYNGGWN